ncbi:PAC2 family protein [Lawsonella clevelandensis]|uniref:PAC2 family protein n=1 Tax=Lawsonella clevelandensis TaxID=1528099 RepID=A0A5E3ZWD0_9ACTN|nr:PAC2 family protein [Lawsonella clevelandensis]VHN99703.1 hypothetical protein LC603019_00159 [Lawsonella clevelandensis]
MPDSLHRPQFPRPTLPDGVDSVPFVHGLTGFVDAGNTVFITTQHLLGSLEKELVANFTADAVIEYTNRRPAMLMRDGKLEAFHPHDIKLWLLYDNNGHPFFLLEGTEPDLHWGQLSREILGLLASYGVKETVGIFAATMGVPHTRHVPCLHHGSQHFEGEGITNWEGSMRFPASFDAYLDYILQEEHFRMDGFTAQVPNYLAQSHYSPAAVQLLHALQSFCQLAIPTGAIEKDADDLLTEVNEQIDDNPELVTVVRTMEQTYDSFKEEHERKKTEEADLKVFAEDLMNSEKLGAELEKFLSQVDTRQDPPAEEGDA